MSVEACNDSYAERLVAHSGLLDQTEGLPAVCRAAILEAARQYGHACYRHGFETAREALTP